MEWYGPDDTWPRHGRDYFRAALEHARHEGWSFGKFEGHSFGKVICDRDLPKESRCEFLVFSSGASSENKARELEALVDRCPHRTTSTKEQKSPGARSATERLDEAELLIEAAEQCIEADGKLAGAEELLELADKATQAADEALDDEESALDQALDLEAAAHEEKLEAEGMAVSAGYPADAPLEPGPLLSAAEDCVNAAERSLGRAGRGRTRVKLRERAARTRARILMLQDQLRA
jgi:hypothetical protein